MHLSKLELVNTIRALVGEGAAAAILSDPSFSTIGDETGLVYDCADSSLRKMKRCRGSCQSATDDRDIWAS